MTTDPNFDPSALLGQIEAATGQLLLTAAGFTGADVRAPSLLPNWSRGHVLTHLARNADGGRRLLTWARTGVEAAEYDSLDARDAEIESGAGRTADELLADLRESAAAFAAEYRRMTPAAWAAPVRWTAGQERPAARAADSRLTEVLVHHVDLAAGYTPAQWPPDFVHAMLARVVTSFTHRADALALRLHATDTGTRHTTAPSEPTEPTPVIQGPESALLTWLMGRSPGTGLTVEDGSALPAAPFLY
ncbi:maleylpyruvate isomerase family mycothiol-dependent enzyme [Streptomyces sp. CA-111067]|uniref:maleylpyruvate isomerase family mycothiol-dependent enzyme n=1 Tax=Streptomyces sp. CA-111067 TaxID=3240046 RepID=UPI003D977099